ncbi:glycosyltransferase family 4 protein [Bosea beijingensis]|uniref:glycosyltransferase family 4 protein n=1 Tax=Bosea beijingensis TaxID=3068632 RepID=UPI00274154DC|nr:glycosyltransferase family 4 protein [Bosea sp. REN20]
MSRQKRLAYLALENPRPGQAAHTHVHAIIGELRSLGWDVTLFTAAKSGASGRASFPVRLMSQLAAQASLLMKAARYRVVFVRGHCMAAPAALILRLLGKTVVHEINGTTRDIVVTYPALRRLYPVFAWLDRIQHKTADHLFAVTEALARWASDHAGHDRVSVVTNAADTALFNPQGPKTSFDRPYVVFVGGLVRWHGIQTMLAAIDHPSWPDGVRLVIAGDGVEAPAVKAARSDRLTYLGRQEQDALPSLYRGALASLVTIENPEGRSDYGVMPLKLFESMACGVTVIASDLKGQAELVRSTGCGLVIPPQDLAALAEAVARLAADPSAAAAMGERGATEALAHHSWAARAAAIDSVLGQIEGAR